MEWCYWMWFFVGGGFGVFIWLQQVVKWYPGNDKFRSLGSSEQERFYATAALGCVGSFVWAGCSSMLIVYHLHLYS